jgi:uracil phosphoribosyltransferase
MVIWSLFTIFVLLNSIHLSKLFNLSATDSIASGFIAELRDVNIQKDRMRFRRNIERIGEILAYEMSRSFGYHEQKVITPLGTSRVSLLKEQPVITAILRAGLPLHHGLLNYFDQAESAFVAAYRLHGDDGSFVIKLDYFKSLDLKDRILVLADPMLATGASLALTYKEMLVNGTPSQLHIVSVIASRPGIEYIQKAIPGCNLWIGAIDEVLNDHGYIVPGLGDAGDLSYGEKL